MTTALCRRLDRDAPLPMFVASVAMLLLLAGELHFSHGKMFAPLLPACHIGLAVLWPVFLLEALVHLVARSPRWKQHLAYCLCPPARFGARDACTGQRIWLPRIGWTLVNRELSDRMERTLNLPMILIALGVVPLLALDYYQPEHHPLVHHVQDAVAKAPAVTAPAPTPLAASEVPAGLAWAHLPAVRFATRIGEALIWTAFALEFTVMISVVDRKLKYCLKHWIDVLVIVLPLIAFLRSLRLARLARLHQIGKFTRLYRLRGSVVRAQRGAVVASVVERKLLRNPRKHLAKLQDALAEKEREVEMLRAQIRELEPEVRRQDESGRRVA
jgi:voltage-gated potassium channel